jgi:hypothetical protein
LADTADKHLKQCLTTGPDDKRTNVVYADTMTLLFEAIARVVEIHQPLVETYYGNASSNYCFHARHHFFEQDQEECWLCSNCCRKSVISSLAKFLNISAKTEILM